MNFEVRTTNRFERSAKSLLKRYRSLKAVLMHSIAFKGRGKSGGARIITYTIEVRENEGTVYLIDIYDKSDYSTIDVAVINKVIEDVRL